MVRVNTIWVCVFGLSWILGCGGDAASITDAGASDGAEIATEDVLLGDSTAGDSGSPDVGAPADGENTDAPPTVEEDAGGSGEVSQDSVAEDATAEDTSSPDAAIEDTGPEDAGPEDASLQDAAIEDAGSDAVDDATSDSPDSPDSADGSDASSDVPVNPDDVPGETGDVPVEPTEPPDLVAAPPCTAQTPRRLYGRLIQAGPSGLQAATLPSGALEPFGPPLPGARPPSIRPGLTGSAEILVTAAAGGTCRVLGLDAAGAIVHEASFPAYDCSSPVLLPDGMVVSARVDLDLQLRTFDLAGLETSVVDFPGSSPAAPVVVDGDLIVAHGSTLTRHRPGVGAVSTVDTGLASITRLALSDGVVVATGRSTALTEGLGDRVVRYGAANLLLLGAIELPGAATAEVVLLDGCLDPLANGSSHWWCPGGLVATAGAGWLTVFDAETGGVIADEVLPALTATGLASLDDGRLLAAGALVQGLTEIRALDLQTEGAQSSSVIIADYGAPYCAGSPVADTDGSVYFTLNTTVHRVTTSSAGHGPGWARAGGDPEGAGRPNLVGRECPGPPGALNFSRDSRSPEGENISSALVLPSNEVMVSGLVSGGPAGSFAYLAKYSRSGFQRWSALPPTTATAFIDLLQLGATVYSTGANAVVGANETVIAAFDEDGNFQGEGTLAIPDTSVTPTALAAIEGDVALLARTGPFFTLGLDATVFRVSPADLSTPIWSHPMDWPGTGSPQALHGFGGAVYACGSTDVPITGETQTVVARVDADGTSPWSLTYPVPGEATRCLDLDSDGTHLFALVYRIPVAEAQLVRLDPATGAVVDRVSTKGDHRRIALPSDGRWVVAGTSFSLSRFDGGAVDVLGTWSVPNTFGVVADLVLMDDRPVLIGTAGVNFQTPDLRMTRPAPFGQLGCSAAGRCATADCDDDDPCTVDGCDPIIGACVFTPRAEGAVCGAELTCVSGSCQ